MSEDVKIADDIQSRAFLHRTLADGYFGVHYLAKRYWAIDEYCVHLWSRKPGFNPRSNHTKDSKMVLDAALLNIQHYKARINGKVEQSREKNSALPYTSV